MRSWKLRRVMNESKTITFNPKCNVTSRKKSNQRLSILYTSSIRLLSLATHHSL